MAAVFFPGSGQIYRGRYRFIDFVNENSDKDWNWAELSQNPNITWEDVKGDLASDNPRLHKPHPWNWEELSGNPNITWDNVKENLVSPNPHPWNWRRLSQNQNITLENVQEDLNSNNPHPWSWA